MFNAAAADSFYHCNLLVKSLSKAKYEGLKSLPLPPFRTDQDHQLSIPSMAFVVTKIFKTLDVKLGKACRGSLNASHCHDWIRHMEDIADIVEDSSSVRRIQFLPLTRSYDKITAADRAYTNKFVMDTVDSGDDDNAVTDEDNAQNRAPNPLADSESNDN